MSFTDANAEAFARVSVHENDERPANGWQTSETPGLGVLRIAPVVTAWSTRDLAELAGTTVNTIRHYHRVGLLNEPERRYNGYKKYGVRDLVRLLRIRRLAELGVPLSRIAEVSQGGETAPATLRELDAELAASAKRIQQARADITVILTEQAPPDAPAGFAAVASRLSEPDSSILHVYSRIYNEDAMNDLRRMVEVDLEAGEVGGEIDALSADADEQTRQRLAEQLAPSIAQNLIEYPWLLDPAQKMSRNRYRAQQTFVAAAVELYNPAQLDVFARAGALATESLQAREAISD